MEGETEYEENLRLPRLAREPRTYPPLRMVGVDFMHAAADMLAAARRVTEPIAEAGSRLAPLDTTATFARIAEARRQLSNLERDLARAIYNQTVGKS